MTASIDSLREIVSTAKRGIRKCTAHEWTGQELALRAWSLVAKLGTSRLNGIGKPYEIELAERIQRSARDLMQCYSFFTPMMSASAAIEYEELIREANLIADAARELID